jgi:hypothetical protein
MKNGIYYIPSLSDPQNGEKRKQGLQPSEIKDRDERLSGVLDFIHPLIQRSCPCFLRKTRSFQYGNFGQPFGKWHFFPIWGLFSKNEAVECPRRPLFSESRYIHHPVLATIQLDESRLLCNFAQKEKTASALSAD